MFLQPRIAGAIDMVAVSIEQSWRKQSEISVNEGTSEQSLGDYLHHKPIVDL